MAPEPPGSPAAARSAEIALPLVLQLRWLAVFGQAGLLLLAFGVVDAELPYGLLGAIVAVTAASNLGLERLAGYFGIDRLLPVVLTADTLLLTCLLALSGGPHNPFTALYVVHVALAAVAMPPRGTAWIAALSGLAYGAMFRWHVAQPLWHSMSHGGEEVGAHLVGMWIALAVVAAVITYFIGRLVQQLAVARAVAARNDRLASLTTLAAGAAHELGSPLGTIAVAATEIARGADGPIRDDARLIREEVERCRGILDRMSGAGMRSPSASDHQPLGQALSEVRAALGDRAGRVDVECPTDLAAQSVPRDPIQQAVGSLVRNALDASTERVSVRVRRVGDQLELEVADDGSGLPADVLARAGEPFFTTKEPGKGTGLGLYVVRLIAERLGGSLRLRSGPARGTEAALRLPFESLAPEPHVGGPA